MLNLKNTKNMMLMCNKLRRNCNKEEGIEDTGLTVNRFEHPIRGPKDVERTHMSEIYTPNFHAHRTAPGLLMYKLSVVYVTASC